MDESWSLGNFDAEPYFVFIDYCISAHFYAIRLTNDLSLGNPVVTTYVKSNEDPIQIAGSFYEFLQGYLADDYSVLFPPSQVEQINGRVGETATFIQRNFVSLTLRVAGFAPRHLSRSMLSLQISRFK